MEIGEAERINGEMAELARELGIGPGMRRHILLCADQSDPQCCAKEDGIAAWNYLKRRLKELKLDAEGGVYRSKVNCLRICRNGPVMLIYPDGIWYRNCTPDLIERILQEHVVEGRVVESHVFARAPLTSS